MDIYMANEKNLFADKLLNNKKNEAEEKTIRVIKEEFGEDPNISDFNKMEEFGEILMKEEIKEERIEDLSFLLERRNSQDSIQNGSTSTVIQNHLKAKIEFPPSDIMISGLLQHNSQTLLFGRSGNPEEKFQTFGKHFKCSFCPFQTMQNASLQRHQRTHNGDKPFRCNFCPYKATRIESLKKHERTHTGEKPFKCSSCLYQAAHIWNLQRHKRIHTGEKPYKCSFCPYEAAQKASLQNHERTHTGDKPFKCRFCPYEAAQKASLQNHERTHTGDRPFKCSSCPYQAAYIGNLQKHKKRIHMKVTETEQSALTPTKQRVAT